MSTSSDQFRTFQCDTCNLSLNGHWQYTIHLTGKKHLTKLKTKGMQAPMKDHQGFPDSTVSDTESKPVSKYGGSFVTASNTTTPDNPDQSGHFGAKEVNTHGENYNKTNQYGSYSTGHYGSYSSGGQYGEQYGGQYGAQSNGQYSGEYGAQYNGQYGAQYGGQYGGHQGGQYGGHRGGQYGGHRGGQYGGHRGGQYSGHRGGQYGGHRGGHYGGNHGGQYNNQYGRQQGHNRQNDYGQYNVNQTYVAYPDSAVGKKLPTQESSDPVMKAVKANIMGKFPNKYGRYPKKRKAPMAERCDLCDVDYTSQSHKELHICGKKHARKVEQSGDPVMKAVRANMLSKAPDNNQKKKKPEMTERCDLCDIDYTSQSHKEQHLSGKKHARKVEMCGEDGEVNLEAMYCNICELQLNSPFQYSQHILGSIHAKKEARKAKLEIPVEDTTGPSPAKKQFVPSSTTVESTTTEDN